MLFYLFQSDLIISAAGERQIVKADWINPGSIVIDAGVSRGIQGVDEKSIVGDVEFEEVIINYKFYENQFLKNIMSGIQKMQYNNTSSKWNRSYHCCKIIEKRCFIFG